MNNLSISHESLTISAQLSLSLKNQNLYEIPQFSHDTLKIQGKVINYGEQIVFIDEIYLMDTKKTKKISLDNELLEFNAAYFWIEFGKQIVKSFQKLALPYCLEILNSIPLSLDIYIFLFQKLSIQRLKKILSDNVIFCQIVKNLYQLTKKNTLNYMEIMDLEKSISQQFIFNYQRLFYLIQAYPVFRLKKSLESVLNLTIIEILQEPNFIINLAYQTCQKTSNDIPEENQFIIEEELKENFIKNVLKIIQTLQYFCSTDQSSQPNLHQYLKKYVLNKKFFKIIRKNFKKLFLFQRKHFLKIIVFAVNYNNQIFMETFFEPQKASKSKDLECANLWNINSLTKSQDQNSQNEQNSINNQFQQFFVSNIFCGEQEVWEQTISVIQKMLVWPTLNARKIIIKVFNQIIQSCLNSNQIGLFHSYFKQIQRFIYEKKSTALEQMQYVMQNFLIQQINYIVDSAFEQNEKKLINMNIQRIKYSRFHFSTDKIPLQFHPKINSRRFINIFQIYFTLIHKQSSLQAIIDNNTLVSISNLLALTQFRRGAIQGARKTFILSLQKHIYSDPLRFAEENKGIQINNSELLKNRVIRQPFYQKYQFLLQKFY